jgi:hypothetical protein
MKSVRRLLAMDVVKVRRAGHSQPVEEREAMERVEMQRLMESMR